jgi:hypothetical protein
MMPIMMPAVAVAMATGTVWIAPSRSAAGPSLIARRRIRGSPSGRVAATARPASASVVHAHQAPTSATHIAMPSTIPSHTQRPRSHAYITTTVAISAAYVAV